ncbi:MAG: aldo/keto reductase [Candidatus Omnitrophica bacterium]|nr:aldo/keto reductase [Candidatus Omnitrophota bacterium]
MKSRKLGNTNAQVPVISLGTWVFGGDCWGETDDKASIKAVETAIDKGITMIDTAPIYGNGRSETIIGKAIKGKRKKIFIATKCGIEVTGAKMRVNLTPSFIRKELENSLQRLGVGAIDLYQCHWPDEKTPVAETFDEMNKLKKEGKIRYIGVSNFTKTHLEKAIEISQISSDQMHYSLIERSIEDELMPFLKEKGVSLLTYGPLGGGILSGKYKNVQKFGKGDVRSFFYKFYKEPSWSRCREFVAFLEGMAFQKGVNVAEVAINWVLAHSEVASCVVGARTPEQVEKNAAAQLWELSPEEMAAIEEAHSNIFGAVEASGDGDSDDVVSTTKK